MPEYETILFDIMEMDRNFFAKNRDTVRERLQSASKELISTRGDIFGINQCLHIASSTLLLGVSRDNLNKGLEEIKHYPDLADKDPTMIATIAMLYYIIKTEEQSDLSKEEKVKLERIHKRFDEINWFIGPIGMKSLQIQEKKANEP